VLLYKIRPFPRLATIETRVTHFRPRVREANPLILALCEGCGSQVRLGPNEVPPPNCSECGG
jgi:gamma-glutamyl:cysteine ligase YbdK (ATP-grasp superfamily)